VDALRGGLDTGARAEVCDNKKSFNVRAYYPKEGYSIEFSDRWPAPFNGVYDSPFWFGIAIPKDANGGIEFVKLTFSWLETDIFKAYGTARRTDTGIEIMIDTVEIYVHGKGGSIILEGTVDYSEALQINLIF
jgi:hypothetical protein